MKKIIITLLSFSLFFAAVSAFGLTDFGEEEIIVFGACDTAFTQTERTQLYNLADFLDTKATIIENKFSGSTELTKAFAKQIYNSLEQSCEPGVFNNYRSFKQGFSEYISNLILGKNPNNMFNFTADPEAEQAILQLQQHIIKILTSGYDREKLHNIVSTTDLSLNINDAEAGINLDTNAHIETQGQYNLTQEEFDIDIDLDLNIQGSQEDAFTSNAGSLDLSLELNLIQKDNLFLEIDALDFYVDAAELGPAEQMQVAMAQNMLDTTLSEIQGKYINISENIEQYATNLYTDSLMNPQLIFADFTNTAMLDFYKDNTIWYGKLNTNICKTLEKIGLAAEACEEEINTMNIETQGKGYLTLQKNGTEYSLGLTDRFTTEKIPETLDLSQVVSRTSAKITKLNIPLDKNNNENTITYQDKKLNINISFDDDIVLNAELTHNNVGNTYTTNMEAVILQNNVQVGSFTLNNQEIITYLQSVNITKPENTITIEELQAMLPDMGL